MHSDIIIAYYQWHIHYSKKRIRETLLFIGCTITKIVRFTRIGQSLIYCTPKYSKPNHRINAVIFR